MNEVYMGNKITDFEIPMESQQLTYSFQEYMDYFHSAPILELRTTSSYFKDMFDYFGKDEFGGFNLFTRTAPQAPAVRGQIKTQQQIYQALSNFEEDGHNSRLLLLIGPNGSAKSSLIKKIIIAAEDYSQTPNGKIFTFSWIFPLEQITKGPLGLSHQSTKNLTPSYAHLEDREIAAIIPSDLKDHPLMLIPQKIRAKLMEDLLHEDEKKLSKLKSTPLFNGDLSQRNRSIYDALLKNYKGDHSEVHKHIRVETFTISKKQSRSAVTIEPQLHVDAQIQQIAMDRRLASLPASLQSINLFSLNGEVVYANRGILEFSDLLKRPLDAFKYLLTTMETRTINLQGILTELDIFFLGTSNELHFAAFKQHPDFNSFRGRFLFLKVPYLINYRQEMQIYEEQISQLAGRSYFEPHALEGLCLWAVMTRLRRPLATHYTDKKAGELYAKLTPMEKSYYIAQDLIPERFDNKEKQFIKKDKEELLNEFDNDALYEGKFGVSPREMKQFIYELSSKFPSVGALEVIDFLKDLHEKKSDYDFLNISTQGDYHHPQKFLEFLDKHFLDCYDLEVRESLGLVDNRSYEEYLERYILHITALLKNEKIKNSITGKFETSDMYFIQEVETHLQVKERAQDFRSHMISRVGAFALDNPGKKIIYVDIFPESVKLLQESYRTEQKKIIDKMTKQFVLLLDSNSTSNPDSVLNEEIKETFHKIINNLKNKYHYSSLGAMEMLRYLINKRY
jgi:predicted Ser/Thr protein kinase